MRLRYASEKDAIIITSILFKNFKKKFFSILPNNPKGAFPIFEAYYFYGMRRIKDNIILTYNSRNEISGILVLEGLGIPIISLNPPLRILINSVKKLGIKSFIRVIFGLMLIEGYPPDKSFLYINTIAVVSKYRRKKIGYKLMKLAEIIAKKRRKKKISLYVDMNNFKAINLYKKLNYQEKGGFGFQIMENIIGVKKYLYLEKNL